MQKGEGVGLFCVRRHLRHIAPLSPVPSLDCAYFLSPPGCTGPKSPRPPLFPRALGACPSGSGPLWPACRRQANPMFSAVCRLFCLLALFFALPPFVFNGLQPL